MNDASPDASDVPVTTTATSLDILELLRDEGTATLDEVVDTLGIAKSTVHRHLQTLKQRKYVMEEGGRYRLSLYFLLLSEPARTRKRGYVLAKEKVIQLAQETGERALFLVEEDGEGVYVHRAGESNPLQSDTMIGYRRPLHALASGKAILSQWSEKAVDAFIRREGLPELTDSTITDPDRFRDELQTIRDRGYAVNDGEHMSGLRAVGVPVLDAEDEVIGGLSIFGPSNHLDAERMREEFPDVLQSKAEEIRFDLVYD
ncbi:MAG: IclR family transcriptional regulator [Halanaeroarchaeum sp.]